MLEYCDIADKYGMTPTELALAWCQSRWFVISTIIGATNLTQLKVQHSLLTLVDSDVTSIDTLNAHCLIQRALP